MNEDQKFRESFFRTYAIYSAVGFQLVFLAAGGALLGNWLDAKFSTGPWLMIVGLFFGTVSGFITLLRTLARYGSKK